MGCVGLYIGAHCTETETEAKTVAAAIGFLTLFRKSRFGQCECTIRLHTLCDKRFVILYGLGTKLMRPSFLEKDEIVTLVVLSTLHVFSNSFVEEKFAEPLYLKSINHDKSSGVRILTVQTDSCIGICCGKFYIFSQILSTTTRHNSQVK